MKYIFSIVILLLSLAVFAGCNGSFGDDGFPDEIVVASSEEESVLEESSDENSLDDSALPQNSGQNASEVSAPSEEGVSVVEENNDQKPNTMRVPYRAYARDSSGREQVITAKEDLQEITDILQQWFPDGRIMSGRQFVNLDTVNDIKASDYSIELVYNGYASDNVFRTCNRLLIKAPKDGDTLIYRYIHGEYVNDPFAPRKENMGIARLYDLAKKWLFVS